MANPRLSAGIAIARCIGGEYHYLLLRAYRYWDFPKGEVESGESAVAAAQREVREETGLTTLDFRWGESCFETKPYGRNKIAGYYVALSPKGEVRLGISPTLAVPEHHEYRWLKYAQAKRLLEPRVREALEWARRLTGVDC